MSLGNHETSPPRSDFSFLLSAFCSPKITDLRPPILSHFCFQHHRWLADWAIANSASVGHGARGGTQLHSERQLGRCRGRVGQLHPEQLQPGRNTAIGSGGGARGGTIASCRWGELRQRNLEFFLDQRRGDLSVQP
jgi:hypothetical protein